MQSSPKSDTFVAAPTEQTVQQVGVVPSSFSGGEDHFGGTKFASLPEPRPMDADLTPAQVRQMTRRAMELGGVRQGGIERIIGRDDWTVLLAARGTDTSVIAAVVEMLRERDRAKRLTVVSPDAVALNGVEVVDPRKAESMDMPAPGIWSRPLVTYRVVQPVLHCDRLISISPLRINAGRPSLAIDNYRNAAVATPQSAGTADTVAVDLFGFHVADYSVLGGTHIFRDGKAVRHNLVLAAASAVAADTAGSAILGLKPETVVLLKLAEKRGYGAADVDALWTRGMEIEEARPRLPAPAPRKKA